MCKKTLACKDQGDGKTLIFYWISDNLEHTGTQKKKADGLMIWSHRQTNRHLGIDKPRCNQSVEGSLCSTVEAVETEVSL